MTAEIEIKIKPLVDALNRTEICWTFSSCEGHFEENEQVLQDRNQADVRFEPNDNVSYEDVEKFLTVITTNFQREFGCSPVLLTTYKILSPDENYQVNPVYVIELKPFDRSDLPDKKRNDIDNAIVQATKIVDDYISNERETKH